ncbi:MAG: hypothetical protein PHG97_00210 [Candidatus Margulisbacteria bacterium]|nr:hypothetical protein [Candidatus Margulisiibacteriota bacterium]
MRNRRGVTLVLVIVLSATLMSLAVILSKIVYNSYATAELISQREQAFWLAEAGIEAGKAKLAHNSLWYTDLPHYPEDDGRWLRQAAVGEKGFLPSGSFLTVREKDQPRFYSVGVCRQAKVVLKVEFKPVPFKTLLWTEI